MSTTEIPQPDDQGPRERILDASLKLFVGQGYFNTNVPDISKTSRCSVGSIYHHFLNKEEIASCLYKAGIQQFRLALDNSFSEGENFEEALPKVIIAFLKFAEDQELLSRYLWLSRHSEFLSQKISTPTTVGFDSLGRKLARLIRGAMKRGDMAHYEAEIVWNILFGIPLSYVRDWLEGFTKTKPSEIAPVIAQACLAALKAPQKKHKK
ncbi:TetR/AcrR family transcriptional regulator [bacterium]|nr:TetR/AcrR family transcriptional regulator [bacterium]